MAFHKQAHGNWVVNLDDPTCGRTLKNTPNHFPPSPNFDTTLLMISSVCGKWTTATPNWRKQREHAQTRQGKGEWGVWPRMLRGRIAVMCEKAMPPSPFCLIFGLLGWEIRKREGAACVLGWEGRQGLDRGRSLSCSPLWDHVQLKVLVMFTRWKTHTLKSVGLKVSLDGVNWLPFAMWFI